MCFLASLWQWLPISLSLVGGSTWGAQRQPGRQAEAGPFFGQERNPSLFTSPALLWESVGEAMRVGGWGQLLKAYCSWYPSPGGKPHFISKCSQSANVLSSLLAAREVTHLRRNIFSPPSKRNWMWCLRSLSPLISHGNLVADAPNMHAQIIHSLT